MQMTARIPQIIEDVGDHTDQLAMASDLQSSMSDYAAAALVDPNLKKKFVATMALPSGQQRAFPATIGEAIGLQYWDGKCVWEMTEAGWAPAPRPL
jgi:hypothetical protein